MKILNPLEPNPRLRFEYDRGSSYETELRLGEALSALVPAEKLIHPDHRLFQITHLITEYAWVGMHHTLCDVVAALASTDLVAAGRLLRRADDLAQIPVRCLRILVGSLPQTSFLRMRDQFESNASGLDSPGARGLRKAALGVWDAFEAVLDTRGLTLAELGPATEHAYDGDTDTALVADVVLGLHRFDSSVMEWRQVHLSMVWQLLGGHPAADETADGDQSRPTSMRGKSITDLERLAVRPLFPKLWLDSTARYRSFGDGGSYASPFRQPAN